MSVSGPFLLQNSVNLLNTSLVSKHLIIIIIIIIIIMTITTFSRNNYLGPVPFSEFSQSLKHFFGLRTFNNKNNNINTYK